MTFSLVLILILLVVAVIDFRTRRIPEVICVAGMVVALLLSLLVPDERMHDWPGMTLHVAAPRLPAIESEGILGLVGAIFCVAAIAFLIQPGMVISLRAGPTGALHVLLASVVRRGVLWIAIPGAIIAMVVVTIAWLLGAANWHAVLAGVVGAASGLLMLGVPQLIGKAALGKDAIGSGDVILLGMVGGFTGWQPLVLIVPITLVGIAVVSSVAKLSGTRVFPCGPIIALASVVTVSGWTWIWPRLSELCAHPWLVFTGWAALVVTLASLAMISMPRRFSRLQKRAGRCLSVACVATAALAPAIIWGGAQWVNATAPTVKEAVPVPTWIARAGGAVAVATDVERSQDLIAGSNSLQALEQSYRRGVRWFELDMSVTRDGYVVAIADWERDAPEWFARDEPGKPMSLAEFTAAEMDYGLNQITLATLLGWLGDHRDAMVLIDTVELPALLAGDEWQALSPSRSQQLVIVVRSTQDAELANSAGFANFILSLNYTRITDFTAIWFCRRFRPIGVAAHHVRWRNGQLAKRLSAEGVPTIATSVTKRGELVDAGTDAAIADLAAWFLDEEDLQQ